MKRLLREYVREILLLEAPLADIYPPKKSAQQKEFEKQKSDTMSDPKVEEPRFNRFVSSQKYRENAVKTYANLSVPIHVVPLFSQTGTVISDDRQQFLTGKAAKKFLVKQDLGENIVQRLCERMEKGDAVFCVASTVGRADFLPTPWMIVHSMFDPYPASKKLKSVYDAVNNEVNNELLKIDPRGIRYMNDYPKREAALITMAHKALTMKSARDSNINRAGDVIAEILTQSIVSAKGFVFNETGDEKFDSSLRKIAGFVANARQIFESEISGKLIVVYVDVTDVDFL